MTGLAITCYSSPERCQELLLSLRMVGALDNNVCWLNDQSTDPVAMREYQRIAAKFDFSALHKKQGGATVAKRQVAEEAQKMGLKFVHQMSEDFSLNVESNGVKSGHYQFIQDSESLLIARPELDFVKYNILTPPDGDMAYIQSQPWGTLKFEMMQGVTLPFLTGSVVYSNWPACWRVSRILEMWEAADKWEPKTEKDRELVKLSGGEWAASMCGYAKGAVLVAQPLIHGRRHTERPEGSIS